MKKMLTLSVAILALGASANAQNQKTLLQPKSSAQATHMRIMNMLLNRANNNVAEKTTTLKQRVIAQSNWDQSGPALTDSAAFGYNSNYRGSSFNYNVMGYFYSYPSLNNLALEYLASDPDRLDVKADSISSFADNGSGIALSEKQNFIYNTANKIADYRDNDYTSTPTYIDRYIHTYDGQGRLSVRLNLSDAGSGMDTSAREFFKYNAQGKLTLDSLEQYDGVNIWTPAAKIAYTYDASFNPTNISLLVDPGTGTMIPYITYDNTFYTNNTLKTSVFSIFQGTGVEPAYLDSFGYASGITNYFNYVKESEYDANSSSWVPSYLQTRHINSHSVPDTVYANQWDGTQWVPFNKNVLTYNSFNNPVTAKTYNSGSTTPDFITTYYYQQYNDPTSVPNTPAVAQDIKAYPNPTTGNLNIKWSNAIIGAPVTVSIVGMNGQMVYSESLRWNQAVEQLSIGHLQTGIYAMVITDQNGQQVFHQNIVKQ